VAGIAVWNTLQIILVLGLCLPECAGRRNLSHDFTWPQPRGLHVGDCSFGDALLFGAGIEDRRAIAESDIISLTIFCGRIVNLEKELEQPSVADLCRIENNLDSFGVSSVVAVGSIRHVPTRIAHPR
jgi:hypothetical protein